jgi:cytochrome c oxidase cbb3-type subunit III
MPTKIEKDEITGTDTTGHEWDGIKELNTPLPKWWVYVFYATIAWALVWYVLYPAWPSFSSHTPGVLGYTTRGEFRGRMAEIAAQRAPILSRIRAASLDQIRQDPELLAFATVGGRTMFAENCAPCHGPNGSGRRGYPSLADDVWLWGGRLADIHQTIRHGIRNPSDQARVSQMPRFGADGILTPAQILDVAEFVLSLTDRATDRARVARGARVYADSCVSCHGERGEGKFEFGAPRLNSAVWLYGGDRASIIESIAEARAGVMPAWVDRLDEATIKMLTIYVHALGGGQ